MLDQGELFDIPNPCRGVCEVNNRGYCKGCLRSRNERFHWQEFTPFQKQLVVNACARRRLKILQAANRAELTQTITETPDIALQQPDLFNPIDTISNQSVIATTSTLAPESSSVTPIVDKAPRHTIDSHQQIDLF
ncbi:MAG: DUF1289 domain-containing protein [Bacterioplanes sp.]|nr:DUF1289 domain-containing protein [Bacterioplanes sp.]